MRDRIAEIQQQIADLKKQWPAHSTPPALLMALDELEAELELESSKPQEDEGRMLKPDA